MNVAKIVVGTDFSQPAADAAAHALRVARRAGASLILAHAHPMSSTQKTAAEESLGIEPFRAELRAAMEATHRRLEQEHERLSGQGVEVSQVLVDVPAEQALCDAADDLAADMVVVGSHGRTGLRRFLLGSVAEKVVRGCTRPVFVARGPATRDYERVLVPVDLGPSSDAQLAMALDVAAPGAQVTVLHCWQVPLISYGTMGEDGGYVQALSRQIPEDATARGEQLVARHSDADCELSFALREGSAAHMIQEAIEDTGPYDLVVVGRRAVRGARRWGLGSVAEATVRHSPGSVLVTPAPE